MLRKKGFVDGPNLYAYVNQNPWTSFDPEGLASIKDYKEENKTHRQTVNKHGAGSREGRTALDKIRDNSKAIKEIEKTAKKWNEAAKKEVIKASELNDSWGSFDVLRSTDPADFLAHAAPTMKNYNSMLDGNPHLLGSLEAASARTGISPDLVLSVLTMEGRGWTQWDGGSGELLAAKQVLKETQSTWFGLKPSGMEQVSVGPGQLKGPARDAAGLSRSEAMTYPGAFLGTATWLSTKNPQIQSGYSDVQRAAVYNGGAIGGKGYQNQAQAYGVQAVTIKQNSFIDR